MVALSGTLVTLRAGERVRAALTIGMIFAFQAYKQHFLDAATRLIDFALRYRLLDVHLGRIADIALSPVELGSSRPAGCSASAGSPAGAAITLRDVSFRYGAGEPEVLSGVNLHIAAGELVALAGPSGGGKTTLLKLMMGLIAPTSGQVLVDGQPLGPASVAAWRARVGSVAQDDQLFAGSLAENIAFFDPAIDMDRVVAAARLADVDAAIAAMPMGYDSLVGDMGSALSGGQKQRVLFARALYARPAALFVDEGTAHLDSEAEARLVAALAAQAATRVVSAHRPGALAGADRTIFVAGGQAREMRAGSRAA